MSNQKPDSFLQKFYLHPTHLFKSETMPKQFLRGKGGKEETVIHGKSQRYFTW